ncbi:hypothetical protein B0H11DRAFT_2424397 [Mycena galericulata]|nr:hypothetical protein B0H11DRAFT_2424397 [Mycena galericulata]
MSTLDQDAFSHILSHVFDSRTVYTVLSSFPKSHVFFLVALRRLCELPVFLNTDNARSATAANAVLEYLLSSNTASPGIAESIRHLVCSVEHDKFETRNKPSGEEEGEEDREEQQEQDVEEEKEFSSVEESSSDAEESASEDVDVVAFHERLPELFRKMRNLESIDHHNTPGLALSVAAIEALAPCERLRMFAVDSAIPRPWKSRSEAWNPSSRPSGPLSHPWSCAMRLHSGYVERDPFDRGRCFPGLISFLSALGNLSSLWVDERVLLPRHASAGSFLYRDPECAQYNDHREETRLVLSLREILSQLESLRVGFGTMDHTEVDHVLTACDPAKLRQFGFEWAWARGKYGHADRISPDLLAELARFPKLTDVHILFPRPETQVSGAPDPTIDGVTLGDVTAIFACNASICRVGIGNSVVWERHCGPQSVGSSPGVILIGDGSSAPNHALPAFYHAGYIAKYRPGETFSVYDDNTTPLRPDRGEEIEQLRDLLKRILE